MNPEPILQAVRERPGSTALEVATLLGRGLSRTQHTLKHLTEQGALRRVQLTWGKPFRYWLHNAPSRPRKRRSRRKRELQQTGGRYEITTLHGWPELAHTPKGSATPPLIYLVHDTDHCWQTVAVFDERHGDASQRRRQAEQHAQQLERDNA